MSRAAGILRTVAIAVGVLIVVLGVTGVLLVRSGWFRNYISQKIISSAEASTGGRVDVGNFRFDWTSMTAVMTNFVIHGNEPAGAAPLLRVARVQLNLRFFTSLHRPWEITYLGVDRPEANVIVYADGRTNIPSPRTKSSTNPLQTVIDLAIGRFQITNGEIAFAARRSKFNLQGKNLRAQLSYETRDDQYRGNLTLQPTQITSGRNMPVDFSVNLPMVLSRNKIDVHDATVTSAKSSVTLDASLQDLNAPQISARAAGHIALADLRNAANLSFLANQSNGPSVVDLDAAIRSADHTFEISQLRVSLGPSQLQASGNLNRGIDFSSRLALSELGRLAHRPDLPNDVATLAGVAKFDSHNDLNLTQLRASAFGGEFSGDASLKDFSAYEIRGDLAHLDLERAIRAAGENTLPYDGFFSGPIRISGNIDTGLPGVTARAQLSIAPGARGIPLSGNLTAEYSGAQDDLSIDKSLILLPHSHVSMDGSVGKRLNVAIVTTNLDDLFAAIPPGSRPPVSLRGGRATWMGTMTGSLSDPRISGQLIANRFSVAGRAFDSISADASASKKLIAIQNGSIGRGTMQARFSGTLGLRNWKPLPNAPLSVNASLPNGDLADLLALAGQPSSEYSGHLSANASIHGTLGNPQGAVAITVTDGMIQDQPFDRAQARINLADQLVSVPRVSVQLGQARVDVSAEFRHPRDRFTTGQIRAEVQGDRINLAQVRALQKQRPNTSGSVELHANLAGDLLGSHPAGSDFQLTSLNVNACLRGFQSEGQKYGDLTAAAATNGQAVNYQLISNFAGANIHVDGNTQLTRDYPTDARAQIGNLPVQRALAVAHRSDIPVKGTLSGNAAFMGTIRNPQGRVDVTLANGTIYGNAVDRIHARADYQPRSLDLTQLEVVSGGSRVNLEARFDHPVGDLQSGELQFRTDTNAIDLARIARLTEKRPGLTGTLQAQLSGAAQVRPTGTRILLRELNGDINTTGLALYGKNLGDVRLVADTSGRRVNVTLESRLAGASLDGNANIQLTNDYPANARLTFNNVTWAGLQPLLGVDFNNHDVEASADGEVSLNGPLLRGSAVDLGQLRGSLQVTRLRASANATIFHEDSQTTVLLQNQGPIAMTLDHEELKIQSAHLTGPQTDFQASGTIPLNGHTMNVALKGNVNLAVVGRFDPSITSAGSIVVDAGFQGTLAAPALMGEIHLRDASFTEANWPAGIWKANGAIALNGSSATIRNLSAESGGGQVSVTGFATMTDTLRFGLQAKVSKVRMLVEQGVGLVASADVTLTGTSAGSVISGAVTIDEVSYAAKTDLGSILSLAAPPVQAPPAPSPVFENMRLDVRVRNSSALGVQSSIGQNLQVTADLRLRGTVSNPGVLGRAVITQGKLVFFGSTYTVNTATIAFYNPIRIEPVVDLSLGTQAQGVNVTLKVTGPINNLKLSYTSNPPLQFQEIVGLLATGTTPTSDPTLLANQPALPPQSFQQMGESAIIGRAIADPVTNQLQRVFGVTQLKINPAFTSGSQLPAAQIALQQQITSNVTFNYVTTLNTANAETIEAVWTFSPEWSAQALRDYSGIFSVTVIYKRQFR